MRSSSRKIRAIPEGVCPEGECLFWPRRRWLALQNRLLTRHLAATARSGLYAGRIKSVHRHGLADLAGLPTTSKQELVQAADRAYACRSDAIREWVTTSGTTGQPLRVPLTAGDLQRLAINEAVALNIGGIARGHTLLIAVAIDRMFVAGLAYWLGAQRLGASSVRAGPFYASDPFALRALARDYHRPFLLTVPSLLAGSSATADTPPPAFAAIINIAEPVRGADLAPNALATRLAGHFHTPILSTYATTEICTTFAEGPQCRGGHLNPRLAIVEILNEAGQGVPDGHIGEVVVTPLGVEGLPLLRFRTGDLAALYSEPCPCGRTTPRLGPIVGRLQQRLKVRGVSLFPTAISQWLQALPEVQDFLIIVEQGFDLSDQVTLHIALRCSTEPMRQRLKKQAATVLRSNPKIVFSPPARIRELQRQTNPRKPTRFLDRRGRDVVSESAGE